MCGCLFARVMWFFGAVDLVELSVAAESMDEWMDRSQCLIPWMDGWICLSVCLFVWNLCVCPFVCVVCSRSRKLETLPIYWMDGWMAWLP